jgi:hypothetical protein
MMHGTRHGARNTRHAVDHDGMPCIMGMMHGTILKIFAPISNV